LRDVLRRVPYIGGAQPIPKSIDLTLPQSTPAPPVDMTVVVAAVEARRSLSRCLDALAIACAARRVDIIVVGAGENSWLRAQLASRPDLRFFTVEGNALTPRLWSEGIARATSPIVALTTAHFFVTPGWCDAFLSSLRSEAAIACGGPLRLAPSATTLDAAIFFLRYSAFIEGREKHGIRDIAGDNAAYVVSRIPPDAWDRNAGFWELDVNRKILESGHTIDWNDAAVAEFGLSFSLLSICRHRYEHGRLFGIARVSRGDSRVRLVFAFPFVPFVLAFRAWQHVAASDRYRGAFLRSLPAMLIIALCWAAGEAAGAIEAGHADRR
jgi:hypothetical protein